MPAIRLAGAIAITRKYFKHDISADRVGLLPAIHHTTGVIAVRIDEYNEAPIHPQEARIIAILIAQIG
jgi:hypothetical protein